MAQRIVVIGGESLAFVAWALQKRGWTVTVVTDREFGTGIQGQCRLDFTQLGRPVPSPGLVRTSMK